MSDDTSRRTSALQGGEHVRSVPMVEDFITKHYEETGHTLFGMDVFAHTICVKVIDAGKEEPCGMN